MKLDAFVGYALVLLGALSISGCGDSSKGQSGNDNDAQAGGDTQVPDDTHYRWYPALDLTQIPFHTSDGAWGKSRPIGVPAAPVTTRSVTVHTLKEFQDAALTPGTEITLGASFDQNVVIAGDITDVDIIVPPDVKTVDIELGRYSPPSKTTRLRIRGPTVGKHSGGLVGSLTFPAPTSDLIIDGLDMNGEDRQGGGLLWYFSGTIERAAVVNIRGIAVGAAVLGDAGIDVVVAGSNIVSGAFARGVYTLEEGWGLRFHSRQVIVYKNRIEGPRYHKVRVHTAADETDLVHYSWINDNVFVDPHEGRITTALGQPGSTYEGFWAQNNTVYAYSTCMGPDFSAGDYTRYARLTDNTFYGNITPRASSDLIDQTTGNVYNAWQAPPDWDDPGDPNELPLPQMNPAKCQNPDCSAAPVCPGPP